MEANVSILIFSGLKKFISALRCKIFEIFGRGTKIKVFAVLLKSNFATQSTSQEKNYVVLEILTSLAIFYSGGI